LKNLPHAESDFAPLSERESFVAEESAGPDPMTKPWSGAGRERGWTMLYYANKAAAASVRNNIKDTILDRVIGDLILGLDMAADQIPPSDLGGTNEAIVAINAAVDFLDGLRRS